MLTRQNVIITLKNYSSPLSIFSFSQLKSPRRSEDDLLTYLYNPLQTFTRRPNNAPVSSLNNRRVSYQHLLMSPSWRPWDVKWRWKYLITFGTSCRRSKNVHMRQRWNYNEPKTDVRSSSFFSIFSGNRDWWFNTQWS